MESDKNIPPTSLAPQTGNLFLTRLLSDKPRLFLYQKICVFLVAFLVFANGIPNGFNIDDVYYTTENNPYTAMGIRAIPSAFTTYTFHDNNNNSFDYRPLTVASFALQHQLLGGAPATSHFISVLIYAFICMLLFVLLRHWFGADKSWFALLAALLYAVHPLHTEVVDNIKCRDELLATLFCLLSMIATWKWYVTGKAWRLVLGAFLFMLGLLCKTTIVTYVAVLPLAFYFFSDMPLHKIILPFLVFGMVYIAIGLTRAFLLPDAKRVFLFFENPLFIAGIPPEVKTATASYVMGWYAYLHVVPYPLSFYYGYSYVPLVHWSNLVSVLSLVVYLVLVFVVIKTIRKKSLIAFGTLIYLVCILPFSNLFSPAPGMMAERFAFTSSLGFCILLVAVLYRLFKLAPGESFTHKNSKYLLFIFLFIFLGYSGMSITRNAQWKSGLVLFGHDIKHLQKSAKANMFYGEQVSLHVDHYRYMYAQGPAADRELYKDSIARFEPEAKAAFYRALAVVPDYDDALNYLATIYIREDSFEEAKTCLLQTRVLTPGNPDVHYNLAMVYASLSRNNAALNDSSVSEFKKVIQLNPKYGAAYGDLGMAYLRRKDTGAAISNLLFGIKELPDTSLVYMQMTRVYLFMRDTSLAVQYAEKAASVPHTDPIVFKVLQDYYHSKNNIERENYYRNKMQQVDH